LKFYLAWILADAVNNASGLGFNGYDSNQNAKWDLVSNVDIINLEVKILKIFQIRLKLN
jgi:lysophospholipid acyltransferase 1/2